MDILNTSPTITASVAPGLGLSPPDTLTPAMRQYREQKERVGDAVLLFRMGDFYETFYDDAILCSKVLGIALTSRTKGENPVPLAGIPYHALEPYLRKLVTAGYRVAISEQIEDARLAKGVVRRDIVRIVTGGTLTDEALLDERDDNLLAALCIRGSQVGLAIVELVSGRFEVIDATAESLLDELVRVRPAELLIDDDRTGPSKGPADQLHELCATAVTRRPTSDFLPYQAERALLDHFGVTTLAGFGFSDGMNASLCAAGGILQYLRETQKTGLSHITTIRRRASSEFLLLDHSTWRSLEIERTLRSGSREGSLLNAIDRTAHPIGSRKLKHWLRSPLTKIEAITRRQDAVAWFVTHDVERQKIRQRLRGMADVERIAGRIALGRTTPRDLSGLRFALQSLPDLITEISDGAPDDLAEIGKDFRGLDELTELLVRSIIENPPFSVREGGIIADGFDAELDRLRAIGLDGRTWLAEFQQRQIERTGISSLKVGYNRVFGYYIEVPHSASDRVPPEFIRKQTIKNAERYLTEELKNYETEVLTAKERSDDLEFRLFDEVRSEAATKITELMRIADAIGRLDCLAGLAELAVHRRYIRPQFVEGRRLEIKDGRHPVLDQSLGDAFVPNDTAMDGADSCVFVITGPNMAGKSTYIRQVALLTLLAQTGSFVPAAEMTLSAVDRIFARVGSSDEIMRGQSTFMVEMTEAANILHNATDRSLVVLDELGRGTSTFDGLSLAWAITEHLARETRCRTLVATHYHEMTELASLLKGVKNFNVAVREYPAARNQEEGIAFLHRIVEGAADKSYGIHVARLAGLPKPVIQRSREVLDELQRGFERESRTKPLSRSRTRVDNQLALFREPGEELLDELNSLDAEDMAPPDALAQIKVWKTRFTH